MILVILGAPGAGKGTQARSLAEHLGTPHVSTGDLLRGAVGEKTELGLRAKSYMEAGELVPDDLILGMVRESLERGKARNGCILDGYPRNTAQAESLGAMLAEIGMEIGCVLNLKVSEEELVARIAGRQTQESRSDDSEETARNRFRVYDTQTAPVVAYYRDRGVLQEIDGEGAAGEVGERIRGAVEEAMGAGG